MTTQSASYPRHRFPAEIISHAVWLYHVFSLSLRDVELILAERGVVVTHESVRPLVPEIRRPLRQSTTPARPRARRYLAPRRGVHPRQGCIALSVARRGPERRRAGHPGGSEQPLWVERGNSRYFPVERCLARNAMARTSRLHSQGIRPRLPRRLGASFASLGRRP